MWTVLGRCPPATTCPGSRILLNETLRSGRVRGGAPLDDVDGRPRPTVGVLRWTRQQISQPYVQLLVAQLLVGASAAAANILISRALAPSGRGLIALLLQVAYLASQILLLGSERSFIAGYHGSSPA